MAQAKATVKGRGPELFGRGIDLLFGEEETASRRAPTAPAGDSVNNELPATSGDLQETSLGVEPGLSLEKQLTNGVADVPTFTEADVDQFLRMAAEAFLRVQTQKRHHIVAAQPSRSAGGWEANPIAMEFSQGETVADIELDVPPLPDDTLGASTDSAAPPISQPINASDSSVGTEHGTVGSFSEAGAVMAMDLDVPPLPDQIDQLDHPMDAPTVVSQSVSAPQLPPVVPDPNAAKEEDKMSDQATEIESANQPVVSENGQPRKVAPPGVTVSGPVTAISGSQTTPEDGELSETLVERELPVMSRKEIEEILERLPKSDLRALDKQIDHLYEEVTVLFSGKRREITVAFEILRKARIILLKDPEQYAEAEFYVRQVQARAHQVRQSIEEGGRYWPRILVYQTAWLVALSIVALITTVNGANFVRWMAFLLGVPGTSESVGWAVLFISTLAWGGIGGATSALWSLYYHISVQRDYEPIENLWYYTQPLIGMVLGGIVFLIMGAGFLVVEATPTVGVGSMGARLVPAVIAVIAGFRQTVVLDLIERIVALIAPTPADTNPKTTTEELTI